LVLKLETEHLKLNTHSVFDQLSFFFQKPEPVLEPLDWVEVGATRLPVHSRRNPRARRYLLYVRSDRSISLTLPRRGNLKDAMDFVRSRCTWIERQLRRMDAVVIPQRLWSVGTEIFLRGETHLLQIEDQGNRHFILAGPERIPIKDPGSNLRPLVHAWFQKLAKVELPPRVGELAAEHGLSVLKVTVRNQSTRWGSCSTRGNISLNWRLIQTPENVRDYIILHELMHLKEMNHSPRFWTLVEKVCPTYRESESWLKVNGPKLGL
jgi:predicted metal-dependent hydrolase